MLVSTSAKTELRFVQEVPRGASFRSLKAIAKLLCCPSRSRMIAMSRKNEFDGSADE